MKRYLLPVHIIIVALVIGWFALGSNPLVTVASNNAVVTATTQISVCGNGIKEGGEQCDGNDIGGRICTYLGYDSGTLACNSACGFDTSSCNTNAKETAIPLFSKSIGGNYTITDSTGGDSLNISLASEFYSQDVRLQMFLFGQSTIATSKPAPSGKSFVGDVYVLLFTGPNGNIISTLSKPATITLSYAHTDINGINPDTLSPYQRKNSDTSWHSIDNYSLNKATKTIIFNTDSFSPLTTFAIFGASSTPTPQPPSGGGGGGGGAGSGGGFIPASATTVTTGVTIQGMAYPLSKVILLKDAQEIAQTIAGSNANFSFKLTGLSPGTYMFSLYAQDEKAVHSPLFSFSLTIQKGVMANVGSIFLAPTLSVNKTEVRQGGTLTLFGQTAPKSTVTIMVHSVNPIIGRVLSSPNGIYVYDINTSPLALGNHSAQSKTTFTSKLISGVSQAIAFTVGNKTVTTPSKENALKADLNGNGKVNIVDFSILAYWYGRTGFPARMDLNGDGKINLIDFSILAYYWTG